MLVKTISPLLFVLWNESLQWCFDLTVSSGPAGYDASAICFYKALKVYPAPAELVMVYQKTIPPEVFTLVMGMLSMDVGVRLFLAGYGPIPYVQPQFVLTYFLAVYNVGPQEAAKILYRVPSRRNERQGRGNA